MIPAALAAVLAGAALVAVLRGALLPSPFPAAVPLWGSGALGLVFLVRAVGELRLVGFFKRVKGTRFAKWDSWLFSPLCLFLAAGFFFLFAD